MSDNGYLPSSMTWVNRYRSPWFAIALNYVIGMICFLPFPGWQSMVGFLVICFVLAYAIGPIACLTLRYTAPTVSRRFKVPAVSLTCYCAFTICNLMHYRIISLNFDLITFSFCQGHMTSRHVLLGEHLSRWRDVRSQWRQASHRNDARYAHSHQLLKQMFEKAHDA